MKFYNLLTLHTRILRNYLCRILSLPPKPWHIFLDITFKCQSKCKSCELWKIYKDNTSLIKKEFKKIEYSNFFSNLGHIPYISIIGGEPFLRKDFSTLITEIIEISKPLVLTITTNGLYTEKIISDIKSIMKVADKKNTMIELQFSLDDIGSAHDNLRGVKNNFKKFLRSYFELKNFKKKFKNLYICINTTISKYNFMNFFNTFRFIKNELKPDIYVITFAQNMFNYSLDNKIKMKKIEAPTKEIKKIIFLLLKERSKGKFIEIIASSLRKTYYEFFLYKEKLPCFAMFSTFELDPYGNIHPCPNLRSKLFRVGNLRKSNYNFKKIWLKENSKKIRNYIKKDNCLCNICGCISYVNIINSFRGVCRWLKILMIKK